jgi:hypothetical protein
VAQTIQLVYSNFNWVQFGKRIGSSANSQFVSNRNNYMYPKKLLKISKVIKIDKKINSLKIKEITK